MGRKLRLMMQISRSVYEELHEIKPLEWLLMETVMSKVQVAERYSN